MLGTRHDFALLLNKFPISDFDSSNAESLELLHALSVRSIIDSGGHLPDTPPFGKHPYLTKLIPDSTIKGLMVGTFPPISYLRSCNKLSLLKYNEQEIDSPDIDYFHGNQNSLWKHTPIDIEAIRKMPKSEQPTGIDTALYNAGICYTDIVLYCQRNLNKKGQYDASDKNLNNIVFHHQVFDYLFKSDEIDRLYFTNASFFSTNNKLLNKSNSYRLSERDAFGLFIACADQLGIQIEYSMMDGHDDWRRLNQDLLNNADRKVINDDLLGKVVFKIRLGSNGREKQYFICSAVSPAAVNRGMVRRNQCVLKYMKGTKSTIEDAPSGLLKRTLECFFGNRLVELTRYNSTLLPKLGESVQ